MYDSGPMDGANGLGSLTGDPYCVEKRRHAAHQHVPKRGSRKSLRGGELRPAREPAGFHDSADPRMKQAGRCVCLSQKLPARPFTYTNEAFQAVVCLARAIEARAACRGLEAFDTVSRNTVNGMRTIAELAVAVC